MCEGDNITTNMFTITALLLLLALKTYAGDTLDYHSIVKSQILKDEFKMTIGGNLTLNADEILANNKLMLWKHTEVDEGFENPDYFNFSRHYFEYQNDIRNSKVYQFIRSMPKGAALHVHTSLMMDADYIMTLTYEDHLYICLEDEFIKLLFTDGVPQRPCSTKWELLSDVRNATENLEDFDANLKKYFTLNTDEQNLIYSDVNTIWERFNKVYYAISSLLAYRPVREKFFYDALKKFYEDNIMYLEIRSGLHNLYELNGTIHERIYLGRLYQRIADKFVEDHPDFIGIKLILTRHRTLDIDKVREAVNLAYTVKKEMPDLFAGFDLVGQEDLGKPLSDFLPVLNTAKEDIDFYFHAGETNWFGTTSDENLIDAIILGAKRLGHAYALLKHPILLDLVRQKDIALEINVVSNCVLSLVKDVRNHPLATFMAMGLPVVLSSDDPGVWGADPLSHDFYVAFAGVASRHSDLRLLKQLAINSLTYSALDKEKKAKAFALFRRKWDKFIHDVNSVET